MRSVIHVALIVFITLFISFCSEQESPVGETGLISLEGKWLISPADDSLATLDFSVNAGEALFESNEAKLNYILLSDGKGVRIQSMDESVPRGYFLFVDRKKDSWTGIWDDQLVRLILQK